MPSRYCIPFWGTLCLALATSAAWGAARWHAPDLFSRYSQTTPPFISVSPDQAVAEFIAEYAPDGDGYEWRLLKRWGDGSHIHFHFGLSYEGRRFPETQMKVHYHRGGWVDFASSNWKKRVLSLPTPKARAEHWRGELVHRIRGGESRSRVLAQDVYWADSAGEVFPAVEVKVSAPTQGIFSHAFLDPDTGAVLVERKLLRRNSGDVYTVSPLVDGATTFENPVLGGLAGGATTLSTSRFRVRREQNTTTPELADVDPNTDFTGDGGWSADPSAGTYNYDCEGTSAQCPNQGFEAVNVYHHVQEFRDYIEGLMGTLGIVPSDVFKKDPIDILVNVFSVDLDGDGQQDDVNNAFYIPLSCTSETNAPEACIWFFRPESVEDPSCGDGASQFFHLARETVVVTHEYQHYVTDMMTGLLQGQGGKFSVGDGLHEGYSDYFGVSFTTKDSGTDQTLVGRSSFRNCTPIQREIGELSVLTLLESDTAALYTVGTTWASGLWRLRDTVGSDGADLLALKAMTFLPVDAGFVDSVEALVKADAALNGGVNAATIRALFYDTLKFTGGQAIVFRDPARGVVEVGFQSCAAGMGAGAGTGGLFVFWILLTGLGGRWFAKR